MIEIIANMCIEKKKYFLKHFSLCVASNVVINTFREHGQKKIKIIFKETILGVMINVVYNHSFASLVVHGLRDCSYRKGPRVCCPKA